MRRFLAVLSVALVFGACHPVSQAEYDELRDAHNQLQASHDLVIQQLTDYTDALTDHLLEMGQVICDIKEKNTPQSAYAAQTESFCDDGEPAGYEPPPPPIWGES